MTSEELKKIIKNYPYWLNEDCIGWQNMRVDLNGANLNGADLGGANLRNADLRNADLIYADLSDADLRNADLSGADLRYANLRNANLRNANLSDTNLRGAILRNADLRNANLSDTNLSYAILRNADLSDTNLSYAILSGADLSYAILRNADLRNANLSDTNLRGAKNVPFIPMIPPERGSFIGFKTASKKIIVLMILADAKRSSATSRKCRCDKAIVLEIQELDGSISDKTEVTSDYDSNFIYKVGELVSVDNFDENRWRECAPGIHFFMSRQEAVDYK